MTDIIILVSVLLILLANLAIVFLILEWKKYGKKR